MQRMAGFASIEDPKQPVLFVGGLSSSTTEEVLIQYFSSYGYVSKVKVARHSHTRQSKGFGYICLEDYQAMQRVLGDIHYICGRKVDIQIASRAPRTKSDELALLERKVFTTNLPYGLTESEFYHIFSAYGEIRNYYIKTVKGRRHTRSFGFLEFVHPENAKSLVNKRLTIKSVPVTCLAYKKQIDLRKNYRKELIEPITDLSSRLSPPSLEGFDGLEHKTTGHRLQDDKMSGIISQLSTRVNLNRRTVTACIIDDANENYRFNISTSKCGAGETNQVPPATTRATQRVA